MDNYREQKDALLQEVDKLRQRHQLSKTVEPDYYEPGQMEYLEQSNGFYDANSGRIMLRFEAKGTRYEGRTEQIERVKLGDSIRVEREDTNLYNHNNFSLLTGKGRNVGNMPAELCNVIAPLFDEGKLQFQQARVSYVEPISKRSRHAKQAILFVEVNAVLME